MARHCSVCIPPVIEEHNDWRYIFLSYKKLRRSINQSNENAKHSLNRRCRATIFYLIKNYAAA